MGEGREPTKRHRGWTIEKGYRCEETEEYPDNSNSAVRRR